MGKTYARIINDTVIDCVESDPKDLFHPSVAKDFVEVPAGTEAGWKLKSPGVFKAPSVAPLPDPVTPPLIVSKVEFLLLFTPQERIAMRKSADGRVEDFLLILAEPQLLMVNLSEEFFKSSITYLTSIGILTTLREADLRLGIHPKG